MHSGVYLEFALPISFGCVQASSHFFKHCDHMQTISSKENDPRTVAYNSNEACELNQPMVWRIFPFPCFGDKLHEYSCPLHIKKSESNFLY